MNLILRVCALGALSWALCMPAIACDKLVYTAHTNYPPYQWREGDRIVGASSDLIKLILDELGVRAEGRYVGPWKRVLLNAKNGDVDLVLALKKVPERQIHMDFTDAPFYENPMVVFARKGELFEYSDWDDLIGQQGVVSLGDRYGESFDRFMDDHLNVLAVKTMETSFDMLLSGRSDYFITGMYVGRSYLAKSGLDEQVSVLTPYINYGFIHHGFSKKSPCKVLLPYINKRLVELREDGTTERLMEENLKYWHTTYK